MIVTDKELDDYLVSQNWTRNDLTEEQLSSLRQNMEWVKNGGAILDGFLCFEKDLQQLRIQRQYSSIIVKSEEWDKLREMVARCEWTFAKSMPWCPHEYIVRTKCSLTEDDFVHFVKMQRNYGTVERWGNYITPYLYIDDYKYWTMGAPLEETTVINRAKASAVNDVHQLYEGINKGDTTMSYVDEYIHKHLGLKDDDKGFNIELINGRLKEIFDCVGHLERIRNNYACEVMQGWSNRLSADFPECKKVEFIKPENIINTGITIPFEGVSDAIAIRIQYEKGKLYYGLACMPATREKRAELQEAMNFINSDGDFIKGGDWLYYKYTSFKDGYDELKKIILKTI